jgi:hypothetical protein
VDGNSSNGCEVNLLEDANNCGQVGTVCSVDNGKGMFGRTVHHCYL